MVSIRTFNEGEKIDEDKALLVLQENADALLIDRGVTWCAGCPHRATFWAIKF